MTIEPMNNSNDVVITTNTDSITGWEVAIPGFGKATFSDGVEYGADSPAIQALAGRVIMALTELGGLSGIGNLGDTSGIRAESDVRSDGLSIDLRIPSSLNLEGRLWAEGHARVPKKSPTVAKGFTVNRMIAGIHGEAFGMGVEVLVAFDPIINANGKGKPLSIQKLADLANKGNSTKLAKYLKPTAIYTDEKALLELALGLDASDFSVNRSDVLISPAAQAAFPISWNTAGLFT